MITSTLTSKNQTTIPKAIVEALGLTPSAQLVYEIGESGVVTLFAKTATFDGLASSFPKKRRRKAVSVEEMDAAIKARAAGRSLQVKG